MKVLQLANYNGPYEGNFIPSLKALERLLQYRGWHQSLAFFDNVKEFNWFKQLENENKHVYVISKSKSIFTQAKIVNQIVYDEGIKIIHTHFTNFDMAAWISKLSLMIKNINIEVVWHVHSPAPVKKTCIRLLRDLVKLRVVGRSVHTIVVSQGGFISMKERGLSERQACVIPNGIDLGRLAKFTKTRQAQRNYINIKNEDVLCLQYAWEPYIKGVDVSLNAMEHLIQEGLKIKLCLIGQEALMHFVRKIYGEVLPNWLIINEPEDVVTNYLNAADIFLSASRSEGFPYAVAEAMAAGLPVISSDIRGLEWAREAPGVVFFPSEDYEGLARGILKIIKWPPEEFTARTAANKLLITGRYDVESWAECVANLYEQIVLRV